MFTLAAHIRALWALKCRRGAPEAVPIVFLARGEEVRLLHAESAESAEASARHEAEGWRRVFRREWRRLYNRQPDP